MSRKRMTFLILLLGSAVLVLVMILKYQEEVEASSDWQNAPQPPKAGKVFLVGGGYPIPVGIRKSFLKTVSEACGGKEFKDLKLVIIPSASRDFFMKKGSDSDWQERLNPWTELGVKDITILNALCPEESMDPNFSKPINSADAVWITGGNQSRLSYLYCSAPVEEALIELLNRGGVIGGSSAGTAIMCNPMIGGGENDPTMKRGFPIVKAIVDQHFLKRNREKRLTCAVSKTKNHTKRSIGIGIEEFSAVVWDVKTETASALPGSVAYLYDNESKVQLEETIIITKEDDDEDDSKMVVH